MHISYIVQEAATVVATVGAEVLLDRCCACRFVFYGQSRVWLLLETSLYPFRSQVFLILPENGFRTWPLSHPGASCENEIRICIRFCIYHITPQGHELGAAPIPSNVPDLSVDKLANQVADVLDFFGVGSVMCLGVTAGAYVLTLFAKKYRERVLGLMLVSPLCKAPSSSEWLYNKVLLNLLYYCGTSGLVKECLLQRYFSTEVRGNGQEPESEIVQACKSLLGQRRGVNVCRFLKAINEHDPTEALKKLQCRTLIFVGENSQFHADTVHMTTKQMT